MKIIAHRADINNRSSRRESTKSSVKDCVDLGFNVEIDKRLFYGNLYLGHNRTEEIIKKQEPRKIKNKVWILRKNLKAFFSQIQGDFNYFWHEEDSYTLTSKGYIWAYPGKELFP